MTMLQGLIQKSLAYLEAPFSSWRSFGKAIFSPLIAFNDLNTTHAWPYLLSSLLVAWVIHRWGGTQDGGRGFFQSIFPQETYRHRSAVADYKFVAFELFTRALFIGPLVSGFSWAVYNSLRAMLPAVQFHAPADPVASGIAASIVAFLVADFGFFAAHSLMHRVPQLWYFHEVHHSAEVLTPVTVYRVHPVENLIGGLVGSLAAAFAAVFYGLAFGKEAHFLDIYGANLLLMVFYSLGFHLRHSHLWLSYGPAASRIMISPAQHQIHHSKDPKHWNKNFGYTFAFWDLLAGTLYVPLQRETIEFGIPDSDPDDFSTVARLYLLPFAKASRSLARRTPLAKESDSGQAPSA